MKLQKLSFKMPEGTKAVKISNIWERTVVHNNEDIRMIF